MSQPHSTVFATSAAIFSLLATLLASTAAADPGAVDPLPDRRVVEAQFDSPAVPVIFESSEELGSDFRPPTPAVEGIGAGARPGGRAATNVFAPIDSDATGRFPAHAGIAAGPDHLAVVGDSLLGIYDKAGTQLAQLTLNAFFAPLGPTAALLQPKVLHDPYEDRFLLAALEVTASSSRTYLAVTAGSDPLGVWNILSFSNLTLIGGSDHFADFPGLAVDEEAAYLTANLFDLTVGTFGGVRLWTFDKGAGSGGFYDGGTLAGFILDPFGATTPVIPVQPAMVFDGGFGTVGTYLVGFSGLNDGVRQFVRWVRIRNPVTTPSIRVRDLALPAALETLPPGPLPDAPQAGTATTVDTGGSEVLQAVWRHPDLWLVTTIAPAAGDPDAGQATAYWMRLDTTRTGRLAYLDGGPVRGEDIAAGTHTFYPALAVDGDGRMTVGFSASAPTTQVGAFGAVREPGAAAGTIGPSRELRLGEGPYDRAVGGLQAWGRWSGAALDPANGCAWIFNQYAQVPAGGGGPGSGRWGSAAGHLCPCSESMALGTGVWRLVAPACDLGGDDTVADVFGDDLPIADHDNRWAVFERDEVADTYLQMALTDPVTPGAGYWVIHLDPGFEIDVEGRGNGSFDLPLVADPAGRRNMLGHPFASDVCWSDVRVVDGANLLTLDQADPDVGGTLACDLVPPDPSCVMSRVAYTWNGGAYDPFDGVTPGALGTLSPLEGFWATAFRPGIALRIPPATSSCGPPTTPESGAGWHGRLIVSADGLRDSGNVFGQLPGASMGHDVHDLVELAPFSDDSLTLVFDHPDWGDQAGPYATDFHPPIRSTDRWRFEVRSGVPGRFVTLEWQVPPGILARSALLDPDSGEVVTQLTPGGSFTFKIEGARRSFVWRLDAPRPTLGHRPVDLP